MCPTWSHLINVYVNIPPFVVGQFISDIEVNHASTCVGAKPHGGFKQKAYAFPRGECLHFSLIFSRNIKEDLPWETEDGSIIGSSPRRNGLR